MTQWEICQRYEWESQKKRYTSDKYTSENTRKWKTTNLKIKLSYFGHDTGESKTGNVQS